MAENLIDYGLGMGLPIHKFSTKSNIYFLRKNTLKKNSAKSIVTLSLTLGAQGHVWWIGNPSNLKCMQDMPYISVKFWDMENLEIGHFLLKTSLWRHVTSYLKTNFRNVLGWFSASKWYITRYGRSMGWSRSFWRPLLGWLWTLTVLVDRSQNLIDFAYVYMLSCPRIL